MDLRWFASCAGRAPVQGQAGPSWQDGADVWILTSTVVRFWGCVERESLPMQDEPERRPCFQHKMSLKGLGMLRIEHQRAGSGEVKSGGDSPAFRSQRRNPVCWGKASTGVRLDRAGAVRTGVWASR